MPNCAEKLSLQNPIMSTMIRSSSKRFFGVLARDMAEMKNGLVSFCHSPVPSRAPSPGLLKRTEFNTASRQKFTLIHPGRGFLGLKLRVSGILPLLDKRVAVLETRAMPLKSGLLPG